MFKRDNQWIVNRHSNNSSKFCHKSITKTKIGILQKINLINQNSCYLLSRKILNHYQCLVQNKKYKKINVIWKLNLKIMLAIVIVTILIFILAKITRHYRLTYFLEFWELAPKWIAIIKIWITIIIIVIMLKFQFNN